MADQITRYTPQDKEKYEIDKLVKTLLDVKNGSADRANAALFLGKDHGTNLLSYPKAVSALRFVLQKDADEYVRANAATSLGYVKSPSSVLDLSNAVLNDKEGEVRWRSAEALKKMGSFASESASSLVKALKDSNVNVRLAASDALVAIKNEEVIPELRMAIKSDPQTETIHALAGLAPTKATVNLFVELLKSPRVGEIEKLASIEAIDSIGKGAKELQKAVYEALKYAAEKGTEGMRSTAKLRINDYKI